MSAHLRPAMLQISAMQGEIELLRAIGLHDEAEKHAVRMRELIDAVSQALSVPAVSAVPAAISSVA